MKLSERIPAQRFEGRITPNGAALFAIVCGISAFAVPGFSGLLILYIIAASFAAVEARKQLGLVLARSALLVLPLAAFLAIVWIGLVGRAPTEIAAGSIGTRSAAAAYVALVCLRLFYLVLIIQLAVLLFRDLTPFRFISALRLPTTAKRLLVFTLSLMETLRNAIDRARVALTASGLITRRFSFRNVFNGWILVQVVWLSAVTIAIRRMVDKWPIEHTLERLDQALVDCPPVRFTLGDGLWVSAATAAALVSIGVSW